MKKVRTLRPIGPEAKEVLVLSRKVGERILIGDKISVTVVDDYTVKVRWTKPNVLWT